MSVINADRFAVDKFGTKVGDDTIRANDECRIAIIVSQCMTRLTRITADNARHLVTSARMEEQTCVGLTIVEFNLDCSVNRQDRPGSRIP